MSTRERAEQLLRLATDSATTEEERRTAAMAAARIIVDGKMLRLIDDPQLAAFAHEIVRLRIEVENAKSHARRLTDRIFELRRALEDAQRAAAAPATIRDRADGPVPFESFVTPYAKPASNDETDRIERLANLGERIDEWTRPPRRKPPF